MRKSKVKILFTTISTILMCVLLSISSLANMLGDVDGNKEIRAADARKALRAAVSLEMLSEEQQKAADVDFSGDIKAADARLILRAAVGLEKLHEHSYNTEVITNKATCGESGEVQYVCSCGEVGRTDKIPATGHTPSKEATCTAAQMCTVCNKVLKKAIGHNYEAEVTAPDCTADGYTTYTCSVCGDSYKDDMVSALNHDYIDHKAQAATCTESGWNAYQTCSRCDYSTYKEIAKLGHDYADHKAQAATCTESGWDAYQTCSRCDYSTYKEIAAFDHDYDNGIVTKAPTCTDNGVKTFTCKNDANHTYTEDVDALGHKEEKISAITPTCEEKGLTAGVKCSVCGEILTAQEEVTALNHAKVILNTVEATCTTDGYEEWKCSVCGKTGKGIILGGHLYTVEHATVTQTKECNRCGLVEEIAFNEYVNSIKSDLHSLSYVEIDESNSKVNEDKLKFNTLILNPLFMTQGLTVDQFRSEMITELNSTETTNSTFYKNRALTNKNLPLSGSEFVSLLEDSDVTSYTIEKVNAVDFREILPDSYTSQYNITYDMTPYNYAEIDNLIKLTVVINEEKYSQTKNNTETTALMKITDVDLNELVTEIEQTDSAESTDMQEYASITCNEATSNATVIYYIDSETNAPVAAMYKTNVVFEPVLSMNLSAGFIELVSGYIDFTVSSTTTKCFFFDNYFA